MAIKVDSISAGEARIFVPDEAAMRTVAVALARAAEPNLVVCLDGELGAGKTHFTQWLAEGLGVAEQVTSPTFTIMAEYVSGRLPLFHFDLYRLDDAPQLEDIGFYELVEAGGVACIEWASLFPDELPEDRLELRLAIMSDVSRTVECRAFGRQAVCILDKCINNLHE